MGSSADTPDVDALANVIATCINSSRGVSGDGTTCGNLFALSKNTAGTVTPTDTVAALLNIRLNPARTVAAIFNLQTATPMFTPVNATPPADYTLPITTTLRTAPAFSLAAGSYTSTQTTTITDSDAGASIYYTTDGSTPGSNSTAYTSAITINQTTTLKAIAIKGSARSAVTSATYTISLPALSPASFTVPYGSNTPVLLTASSGSANQRADFTAPGFSGTFSPATCYISNGSCSVNYIPSGTAASGTYTNAIQAAFASGTGYSAATVYSTVTIAPNYLNATFSVNTFTAFTGTFGATPGNRSAGNLIQGSDGKFYGTTLQGGANDLGIIFNVTASGTYTLLHTFSDSTGMAIPPIPVWSRAAMATSMARPLREAQTTGAQSSVSPQPGSSPCCTASPRARTVTSPLVAWFKVPTATSTAPLAIQVRLWRSESRHPAYIPRCTRFPPQRARRSTQRSPRVQMAIFMAQPLRGAPTGPERFSA